MIYLDHAATTPMDSAIIETVARSMREDFPNSSSVYRIGLDVKNKIERARESIVESLSIPSNFHMVFVSGATEANNLFIKGLCGGGRTVAASGLEHSSVIESLEYLREKGSSLFFMSEYQNQGRWEHVGMNQLKSSGARLLCLSHVNNEIGSINDPVFISSALRREIPRIHLFLDGAQAIGKIKITSDLWDCVSGYSISGHKINGPKGIGLLLYDSRIDIEPLIHGGKHQLGVRSGTLPAPLIIGFAHAMRRAIDQTDETMEKLFCLRRRLIERLKDLESKSPDMNLRFNTSLIDEHQSPAILNFSFPPVEGEPVLHHLEEREIYVGLGSACSAHSREPSKILMAIGLSKEEARCSLRISFGYGNSAKDIDQFVEAFGEAYHKLFPTFAAKGGYI